MSWKVLATRRLPGKWFDLLSKETQLEVWDGEEPPTKSWILDRIAEVDGVIVTLSDKVDREVIDAGRRLKVISTYSVGFDHIDVEYARRRGIRVTHTPDVLTDATADLIFGLILAVARRIVEGDRLIREGGWRKPWHPTFMLGTEVHGKILGILGMGRIGRALVKRASGFDMRVIYHSRKKHEEVQAEYVDLESLFSSSDFLTVTVDLNPSTRHMVSERLLRTMKRDSFLINASRGQVIDEKALVRALEEGWIRGAALDVFEVEPTGPENPLTKFKNVVMTPHLGSATWETRERMTEIAVKNLLACLKGERPLYEVPW
jgi:glyoxylate reductase